MITIFPRGKFANMEYLVMIYLLMWIDVLRQQQIEMLHQLDEIQTSIEQMRERLSG